MTPNSTSKPALNSTREPARNSTSNAKFRAGGLLAGAAACFLLAAGIAGCRVSVDKGPNGEQKKVQIDTPSAGFT